MKRSKASGKAAGRRGSIANTESSTALKGRKSESSSLPSVRMTIGGRRLSFSPARTHAALSVGRVLRLTREFAALTQVGLSRLSNVPQSTIAALEGDRIRLGVERAKRLAAALQIHPASLLFPNWDQEVKRYTSAA
jgi:hypothetical protein